MLTRDRDPLIGAEAALHHILPFLSQEMSEGVVLIGADRRILWVNNACALILGLPRDEIEGQLHDTLTACMEPLHAQPALAAEAPWVRAQSQGQPILTQRLRMRHAAGSARWVDACAVPLPAEGEQPPALLVLLNDVTALVEAEAAVAARGERFRALFEAAPLPTYVWEWDGTDFRLAGFNPAADRDNEGRISEGLGVTATVHHREDPEFLAILKECYTRRSTIEFQTRHCMSTTGDKKHLAVTASYLPPDSVAIHTVDLTRPGLPEVQEGQIEAALRRKRALLLALSQAAEILHCARSPKEVYRTIGTEFEKLGYHGVVLQVAADRSSLTPSHLTWTRAALRAVEALAGQRIMELRIPLPATGFLHPLIEQGRSLYCQDTAELLARGFPGFGRAGIDRIVKAAGAERSIYAPLPLGGDSLAILGVLGGDLTEDTVPAVTAFARQAVIAVENARLLAELAAGRDQLRQLTRQMITLQEEEKRRLARDLHDDAGQGLTILRLNLEMIGEDLPPDAAAIRDRLRQAAGLTREVMARIRNVSQSLRPPALDVAGLGAALLGLCADFEAQTGLAVRYSGPADARAAESTSTCLYRVLQEALTNVAKHAQAHHVEVVLECTDEVWRLVVKDDGRGFDAATLATAWPPGFGLLGMQERLAVLNGRLEANSRPGHGTQVAATVPRAGDEPPMEEAP